MTYMECLGLIFLVFGQMLIKVSPVNAKTLRVRSTSLIDTRPLRVELDTTRAPPCDQVVTWGEADFGGDSSQATSMGLALLKVKLVFLPWKTKIY